MRLSQETRLGACRSTTLTSVRRLNLTASPRDARKQQASRLRASGEQADLSGEVRTLQGMSSGKGGDQKKLSARTLNYKSFAVAGQLEPSKLRGCRRILPEVAL